MKQYRLLALVGLLMVGVIVAHAQTPPPKPFNPTILPIWVLFDCPQARCAPTHLSMAAMP